jgi:hypothetical protein
MPPDDHSQDIDALALAFYSVFDNREGRSASVDEVVAFFHEPAVIAKRTAAGFESSGPAAFARPRVALLHSGALTGFHEWETGSETHVEGDLAMRRSRYAKSGTMNGEPYAGCGTKLFQFVRVQGRWRILSLAWADDE